MNWLSFGIGFAAAFAWMLAATALALWLGPKLKHLAPGNEREEGPLTPRDLLTAGPHQKVSPAAGTTQQPRLLMTSRFYSDGVVYVDNHITRKTTRFDPPADEPDLSDERLERFIRDASGGNQ